MKKSLVSTSRFSLSVALLCTVFLLAAASNSSADDGDVSPQIARLRAKCEKAIRKAYPDKEDPMRHKEEIILAGIIELKNRPEEEKIEGLESNLDRLEMLMFRDIDSDGDGVCDTDDPLPSIAQSPIYWSVESLSLAWNPDALRAASSDSGTAPGDCFMERPVREEFARDARVTLFSREKWESERPGRASAASVHPFNGLCDGDQRLPLLVREFSLFGSGNVGWNALSAQRVSQAFAVARQVSAVSPDTHIEMRFGMRFVNLSLDPFRCRSIEMPVEVDGREIGVAMPVIAPGLEHGFIVPSNDPRGLVVEFAMRLDADRASRAWLSAANPGAPRIAFELCRGRIEADEDGRVIDVTALIRGIVANTVPFEVDGGDGCRLVWRVAPKACGRRVRVTDVFADLNAVADRLFPSRLLLAGRNGWPRSLASWDNGSCGLWWKMSISGSEVRGVDWTESPVKDGVLFLRSADIPALADSVVKLDEFETVDPGIDFLRATRAMESGDTATAEEFFLRAANADFAPAMTWFGYARMKDGMKDEALSWFRRASDIGYPMGDTWAGSLSSPEAAACFRRAADAGQPEAKTRLGLMLLKGSPKDNADEAVRLLRAAAVQDYPAAQVALGNFLAQSGDAADAAESTYWYRNAARNGSASGQMHLGKALQTGHGIACNAREAVSWLTLAADQDFAPAQVELGTCFFDGNGVAKNAKRAAELFAKAAEHGNHDGEFRYGMCLLLGSGLKTDLQGGREYVARAADSGIAMAQYIDGIVSMKMSDAPNAARRFLQAANQGVPAAQVWYGYCLATGTGVAQDKAAARQWFEKAAASGVDVSGYLKDVE